MHSITYLVTHKNRDFERQQRIVHVDAKHSADARTEFWRLVPAICTDIAELDIIEITDVHSIPTPAPAHIKLFHDGWNWYQEFEGRVQRAWALEQVRKAGLDPDSLEANVWHTVPTKESL